MDAQACPYYQLRLIEGIDAQAQTPDWMRERLERHGVRAHHLLVDVTNYVMLELGQPLHAFDANTLTPEFSVRWAREREAIEALDGTELSLEPDMLVIAAEDQPVAIAGIIGGAGSAVSAETTSVVLEAAHFAPMAIAGRARRLKLHTESSHRFERGVDPRLAPQAMRRATELILEHAGGRVAGDVSKGELPPAHRSPDIQLRVGRLHQCLATEVEGAEVERILTALGCKLQSTDDGWHVSPPGWRFDLEIEEDLVEEVARLFGYDRIPSAAMSRPGSWDSAQPELETQLRYCQTRLVERGYSEAVTYSFIEERLQNLFAPKVDPWKLVNPLSQDLSVMRSTLIPSLLQTAQYNLNRQQPSVRLFETAQVFSQEKGSPKETWIVAGVACGAAHPLQWGVQPAEIDFYDVKGDVENLLQAQLDEVTFEAVEHAALHPGQTACVRLRGQELGVIGAVHPRLHEEFDLPSPAFVFELKLEDWSNISKTTFTPYSEYPQVARDLSLVLPETVSAADVEACVRALGIETLHHCVVFDVYRGSELEEGCKSFGLHLIFQSFSHTLTTTEVDQLVAKVTAELEKRLRVRPR